MLRVSSTPCMEAWPEKARPGGMTNAAPSPSGTANPPERPHRPRLPALPIRREALVELSSPNGDSPPLTECRGSTLSEKTPTHRKIPGSPPGRAHAPSFQVDRPTLLGRRHHRGKSTGAGHSEKSVQKIAGAATSPVRRDSRRLKTWTAPPAAQPTAAEEADSGSEGAHAKQRSVAWASEFLMLDGATESAPQQTPTSSQGAVRRKPRRCKTWADRPQLSPVENTRPKYHEAPAAVTTERAPHRRLQRCKTWNPQQPLADRSTPSVISRRTSSQESETTSCASSFCGGIAPARGITPPTAAEEEDDDDFRVSAGFGWVQGQKVGSGSYGCVYKALDKETGRVFAVKKALIEEGSEEDRKYCDRLNLELEIYKELRHPHVVSYLGHDYANSHLYIYLAYVSGGSLAAFLREFGPVKDGLLTMGSRGITEGLTYLHSRSPPIVHRDVKGANVLVDLNFCLKLVDFGCSKMSSDTKSFTTLGSVPWMAPEVIQQQDGHGRKADVWSLGCTIIEMATADKPWGRDTFDNMMFALRHIALSDSTPPAPEQMPPGGSDFLACCLQRSVSLRSSATDLLGHEFIRDSPSKAGRHFKGQPGRAARF